MDGMEDDSYESLLELADRIGDARQAGLTKDVIERLPCRSFKDGHVNGGDSECRICMCEFEQGQKLRALTCFHEYHSRCIDKWLQVSGSSRPFVTSGLVVSRLTFGYRWHSGSLAFSYR